MNNLQKVKRGLCPLGHGPLDDQKRCFKCSSNWIIRVPDDGRYQSSGFGRFNGIISIYDADGNLLTTYSQRNI